MTKRFSILLLFLCVTGVAKAHTSRYRAMWRDDPATTMVIG